MIKIFLKTVPVFFRKFFRQEDQDAVLSALPEGIQRVVFIDTPSTPHLVGTIESLISRGIEVIVRDHHDVPAPRNPREQEIADAANRVRELVGGNATISDRVTHPGCASLLTLGEFVGEGTVIVADPDRDGLLSAMKAVGLTYPGHDRDAEILDGPWADMTPERGVSELGMLLVKGWGALPPFNPRNPDAGKEGLFKEFALASQGDAEALAGLEGRVADWERAVQAAHSLCDRAEEIVPGVWLVDSVGQPRYDLPTLSAVLEARPGCVVTIVRKDSGPIAAKHGGVQYSFAVNKPHQGQVNLQELLPAGFVSSPESGIIANTSFLLHVSQAVWESPVLPALRERLG